MEGIMKKSGLFTLVLLFVLITFIKTTEAKLTIIAPDGMIEESNLIVIGTVTKKEYSEQQRQVSISIETVVKGKTNKTEINLKRDKPPMYGWLEFDFPETGTKIMVLLQQNDQLTLTGDANAVAVLDDNNVRLYNGATMGQWKPEQYEETYKAFLDKSMQSSLSTMPIDKSNDKGETTIFDIKLHHLEHKIDVLINIALIVGVVLVTGFLFYRILNRKRQK
jgi:hypothetical protein